MEWYTDISTLPGARVESGSFLIRTSNDLCEDYILQVRWFQGDLYPDHMGGNVDYSDRIEIEDVHSWANVPHQGETEWQPISTSPKETRVWVFVPSIKVPNGKRVHVTTERQMSAWWHEYTGDNPLHPLSKHAIELREKFGGFWSSSKTGRKPVVGMPTHWRPLPDPPIMGGKVTILR